MIQWSYSKGSKKMFESQPKYHISEDIITDDNAGGTPIRTRDRTVSRRRSTSGSLVRRVSLPRVKRSQSPGFQVPLVRPASCPPVHQPETDPQLCLSLKTRDFAWVRTRTIQKSPELFLVLIQDLFAAHFVMRWVVCLDRYLLGMSTWLSSSSLILFWIAEYSIFRKGGLASRPGYLGALWTIGFHF